MATHATMAMRVADGSGASLQKRNATLYGNEPVFWAAAAPTPGADFPGGAEPIIITQPLSQTVIAGSTASFSGVTSSERRLWRVRTITKPWSR